MSIVTLWFTTKTLIVIIVGITWLAIELSSDFELLLLFDHFWCWTRSLLITSRITGYSFEITHWHNLIILHNYLFSLRMTASLIKVIIVGRSALKLSSYFQFSLRFNLPSSFHLISYIVGTICAITFELSFRQDFIDRNLRSLASGRLVFIRKIGQIARLTTKVSFSNF